jgi:protein-S-isoprenylcysteine O-methyltransferase Ste14
MQLRTAMLGTAFAGTTFFALPAVVVGLNRSLGWPVVAAPASRLAGAALIVVAVALLLHCSRLFRRIGLGTPVPVEPPRHLVVSGVYRYSRNPMYVADVAVLVGLFLHRGEVALLAYAAAFALLVHVWVVRREEPALERRFGTEYVEYRRRTPRWLGLPRVV